MSLVALPIFKATSKAANRAVRMTTPRAITLYRQLLRAHRTKLPKPMRDLGDSYIRNEFRLHRNAKPEHLQKFFKEWEMYLASLRGSRGPIGSDMRPEDRAALKPDQRQKLEELHIEAQTLHKKDTHSS